jgi:hypothetical protein
LNQNRAISASAAQSSLLRLPMRYNASMPKATQQAQRLDTERKHASAPPARVVEQRYRLQPGDLPATGLQAEVTRITRQGVETVMPVLQLRGAPRPLLLDEENVRRMVAVAGSPLQGDWIGVTIMLRVDNTAETPTIRIDAPDAVVATSAPRPPASQWRAALLLLAVLALAFGAVYLVENWTLIVDYLPR